MNLAPEGHRLLSGSSSSSTAAPTITLDGGEPFPAKFVALWRSGRFTDTVVTVEDRGFLADRKVLAAGCDYFERHYDHVHMRDADHPKLLEHVTAAAFEPLLAFLYEGACTFDESLLAPVLQAAHFLGVAPLERAAVAAFTERLSPSNALTAWTWGEELELPELSEAAKVTALEGFDELEKIEQATLAQVQGLVADDRLQAKSEEVVFSAVARYAEAKQPAEAELLGVLRNVRFAQMSKEFLLGTVRPSPMLDTKAGKDMLFEMMAPFVAASMQTPRSGFGPRFLYVMGGSNDDDEPVSTVEVYDFRTNAWTAGAPMPHARHTSAAAVLGGKIYHLGGDAEANTPLVFDPQTGAWAEGTPMVVGRWGCAAAVVGGKLYAIGGRPEAALRSAEAFDPHTGAWAAVAPLLTARSHMGVAVLDGKIYVSGGLGPQVDYLSTVEVYDPEANTWSMAPPMGMARVCHGMAVLGGKIYVAGAENQDTGDGISSVEVFDPQTNSWSDVAPMSTPRGSHSLTAAQGKLYAVGGIGNNGETLATVEAYDPQQDRWEAVAPMAHAHCSHGAAAV